jgi:hypothetical protein
MYPLLGDSPGHTFSEVAGMANRGESPHHEISKITETGNDGETSPPNRSHQVCHHGVSHRFMKAERQVVAAFGVSAFGVRRSAFVLVLESGRAECHFALMPPPLHELL